MWELDHKECWVLKSWCFWTVVLEYLTVLWKARRSNQSILKEITPEYSLEGLMLKMKRYYFGHLMQRADSLEKTLMVGKIEGRRRRMRWLDEMVGWHHWLSGHELKQALGVGDGQGSLVCYCLWGCKESDTTEWLNWTEFKIYIGLLLSKRYLQRETNEYVNIYVHWIIKFKMPSYH